MSHATDAERRRAVDGGGDQSLREAHSLFRPTRGKRKGQGIRKGNRGWEGEFGQELRTFNGWRWWEIYKADRLRCIGILERSGERQDIFPSSFPLESRQSKTRQRLSALLPSWLTGNRVSQRRTLFQSNRRLPISAHSTPLQNYTQSARSHLQKA